MGTEILKSFGTLQSELEQARTTLKGVDQSIKRLIGRDPSDAPPPRSVLVKRSAPIEDNRRRLKDTNTRNRNFNNHNNKNDDDNDPPIKSRRTVGSSVFARLSDRIERPKFNDEHSNNSKQMISKVIVTPKEVPSRQDAMNAQNKDEKFKARNRRMFGALLGTLQKFQQEETKLKPKEEKRAQLEKKIEEHEIKEKEEIKKERQELFLSRKKKQAEIKVIELKMLRMKEFAVWEERQKPRMNFIKTKSKPHILYLPRRLNDSNRTALEESKTEIQKMLDKKCQDIQDELLHIEDRMRRNFESKLITSKDDNEKHDEDLEHDEIDDEHPERSESPNNNNNTTESAHLEAVVAPIKTQENNSEDEKLLLLEKNDGVIVAVGNNDNKTSEGTENIKNDDSPATYNNSYNNDDPCLESNLQNLDDAINTIQNENSTKEITTTDD